MCIYNVIDVYMLYIYICIHTHDVFLSLSLLYIYIYIYREREIHIHVYTHTNIENYIHNTIASTKASSNHIHSDKTKYTRPTLGAPGGPGRLAGGSGRRGILHCGQAPGSGNTIQYYIIIYDYYYTYIYIYMYIRWYLCLSLYIYIYL